MQVTLFDLYTIHNKLELTPFHTHFIFVVVLSFIVDVIYIVYQISALTPVMRKMELAINWGGPNINN